MNLLLYPCPFPYCYHGSGKHVYTYEELLFHLTTLHHEDELFAEHESTEEFITPYLINEEPG